MAGSKWSADGQGCRRELVQAVGSRTPLLGSSVFARAWNHDGDQLGVVGSTVCVPLGRFVRMDRDSRFAPVTLQLAGDDDGHRVAVSGYGRVVRVGSASLMQQAGV